MSGGIVDVEFVQRMREQDPLRAARLYDAEFAEDINVFLTAEAIEAATDYKVLERMPEPDGKNIFAADPAGHGPDAFTLAGVMYEGKTATDFKVEQVLCKAWEKPRSGLRDLEVTGREVAATVRRADPSRSRADGRSGLGLAICKGIVDATGWQHRVVEPARHRDVRHRSPAAGAAVRSPVTASLALES